MSNFVQHGLFWSDFGQTLEFFIDVVLVDCLLFTRVSGGVFLLLGIDLSRLRGHEYMLIF